LLHDASTGKVLRELEVQELAVDSLAFSIDGGILAAGTRYTGDRLARFTSGRPRPAGKFIGLTGKNAVPRGMAYTESPFLQTAKASPQVAQK
jgi:hypothetical protein